MSWAPISRAELDALVLLELYDCSAGQKEFFKAVSIDPEKWKQSTYGDRGGGFWAIACHNNKVLWYNDIEDGFQVSRFEHAGTIPDHEYWCNDDPIKWAIPRLGGPLRHPPSQP